MASSQNYYTILEVETTADLDTIKQAYRKKVRLYHPDQFAAELGRTKLYGNAPAVKKLEQKISNAQQMTQKINEAYAVLSDETDRLVYDRHLSNERQRQYQEEIWQQRMRHRDVGRRTVKSRPHSQNPNFRRNPNQDERVPWILLVGMITIFVFASILFSNMINRMYSPFTTYIPRNPTSRGSIRVVDLQSTSNAEQATYIARRTIVFKPSATARSSSDNEVLGDSFMNFDQFQRAINAYSDAILVDSDNAVIYIKRAIAYTGLYETGNSEAIDFAISDYSQAINLDDSLADVYLSRGMLYYDLWLIHDNFAEEARADLEHYLTLAPEANAETIQTILDELP